jgi:hypothetical protein
MHTYTQHNNYLEPHIDYKMLPLQDMDFSFLIQDSEIQQEKFQFKDTVNY